MDVVSKSKLKARMLEYFRDVERTGKPLVVTDRGRPVLKVVPIKPKRTVDELFADVQGKLWYASEEELLAPCSEEWALPSFDEPEWSE